ncbi:MAG: response regulator [Myxococcales bacterium]|nr:response regulator [Myxococcales bacterium]
MNILVVDDELVNRRILVRALSRYGHCDIARDGVAALELMQDCLEQAHPYELICLDIRMPKLDGQSTLKCVRELEKRFRVTAAERARVIMATALDDPRNIITAYDELCDGYLVKPIGEAALDELLRELFPELRKQAAEEAEPESEQRPRGVPLGRAF